jgi:hypothetical protein
MDQVRPHPALNQHRLAWVSRRPAAPELRRHGLDVGARDEWDTESVGRASQLAVRPGFLHYR